jgi:hypothetical protein
MPMPSISSGTLIRRLVFTITLNLWIFFCIQKSAVAMITQIWIVIIIIIKRRVSPNGGTRRCCCAILVAWNVSFSVVGVRTMLSARDLASRRLFFVFVIGIEDRVRSLDRILGDTGGDTSNTLTVMTATRSGSMPCPGRPSG